MKDILETKSTETEIAISIPDLDAEGMDRSRRAFLDLPGRERNTTRFHSYFQKVDPDGLVRYNITEEHVRY